MKDKIWRQSSEGKKWWKKYKNLGTRIRQRYSPLPPPALELIYEKTARDLAEIVNDWKDFASLPYGALNPQAAG